jgi:protein transport protein SEC61 subunit alpha
VGVLKRYIPPVTALGGLLIAAITVLADLMGAIGTGSGIVLTVTIIFTLYESYPNETQGQRIAAL